MIKKLTADILQKCVNEIKKEKNKENITKNIITPFMESISIRIYPYITLLFIMYSITLILIIIILTLLIVKLKK